MTISPRQAQIIAYVRDYYAATGEWPSERAIARHLGVARSTVQSYVAHLNARGFVESTYSPVRLTPRGQAWSATILPQEADGR